MELHWNEDFRLVGDNLTQPLVFWTVSAFSGSATIGLIPVRRL